MSRAPVLMIGLDAAAILDVPLTARQRKITHGIYLNGRGTHDPQPRCSWPPDLAKDVDQEFGLPFMSPELLGRRSANGLLLHLMQVLLSLPVVILWIFNKRIPEATAADGWSLWG